MNYLKEHGYKRTWWASQSGKTDVYKAPGKPTLCLIDGELRIGKHPAKTRPFYE